MKNVIKLLMFKIPDILFIFKKNLKFLARREKLFSVNRRRGQQQLKTRLGFIIKSRIVGDEN